MTADFGARHPGVSAGSRPLKVVHLAWLGHENFGDDVMALAIRQALAARFGEVEYRIWCEGSPRTAPGVRAVYPKGLRIPLVRRLMERSALRDTDLLMIGGGSVLHSENSIAWKLDVVRRFRRLNPSGRAVGIGLSLGPFPSPRASALCEELLQELDGAAFRDVTSQDFAGSLELPYEPIQTFDLAASYLQRSALMPRSPTEIRRIGVSLRPPSEGEDDAVEQWSEILRTLASNYAGVDVFAFCGSQSFGDINFISRVVRPLRHHNLRVVKYAGEVDPFIAAIRQCDYFISTRLHGSILAFLLDIPFSIVSYHKKCDDLAATIGLDSRYVHRDGAVDLKALLRGIEPYRHAPQDHFIRLAERNFDVISSSAEHRRLQVNRS